MRRHSLLKNLRRSLWQWPGNSSWGRLPSRYDTRSVQASANNRSTILTGNIFREFALRPAGKGIVTALPAITVTKSPRQFPAGGLFKHP
jgi:hypothetical protein